MKLIKRYVDDIICMVRWDPDEYLKKNFITEQAAFYFKLKGISLFLTLT